MYIIELKERQDISTHKSLKYAYSQFDILLKDLRKKELPEDIIQSINQNVKEINSSTETDKNLMKLLNKEQTQILRLVRKELRLIPKNHYTFLWMALGIAVFGLPTGIIYGKISGNMGLLSLGLPIGLGIGIMVGMWLDSKVKKEGRQINAD
ncbi:hypothetical protein LB465_03105 [Salegentibacter sp. LM13S]|uniref:hypothetical protein n=1 Tax=Salegentibacter lacus TaxID=2873599 RepID=UPI001CCD4A2B|nr:hypothetical protein [Salegentibacter lacus]MBZ9629755.1 hypothetical protein [Salegentibacter lacus]